MGMHNMQDNKKIGLMWWLMATFTILLGIVIQARVPEEAHNISRFAGVLTGMGTGILVVIVINWLVNRFSTPEKRKLRQIEKNDERNIQLIRAAYTVGAISAIIILAIMVMLFVLLEQYVASYIALGALYVEAIVVRVAYVILGKRM